MTHKILFNAAAVVMVLASFALAGSTDSARLKTLKELRDSGVLTEEEYQAKLREQSGNSAASSSDSGQAQQVSTSTDGAEGGATANPRMPGGRPQSPVPMKGVPVFDPFLGMNYATVVMPADWIMRGGLVHGTECSDVVSIFFRANSPDGLSGTKILPRFDWAWSSNGAYNPGPRSNCPMYAGPIAARDFLQYMVDLLGLEYVRELKPLGENQRKPHMIVDNARALTRFKINDIQEDEVVAVSVTCQNRYWLPPSRFVPNNQCTAFVYLDWGPPDKLPTLVGATFQMNMAWLQRKGQLSAEQTAMAIGQIVANGQAFRRAMDFRFQQHEEMMAVMQRGYDMSNRRAIEGMNAQSRMADDWCDYALGVQKRYNPDTGMLYKTDSGYTYDWVNDDGKTHRLSDDINFNPNGRGDGHWTQTLNVH